MDLEILNVVGISLFEKLDVEGICLIDPIALIFNSVRPVCEEKYSWGFFVKSVLSGDWAAVGAVAREIQLSSLSKIKPCKPF